MLLTPLLSGFVDELEKIAAHKTAMVGAAIGGYLGSKLPGNTLVNAATGAAVGHGVGSAAKSLKRQIWDDQQAREHATLYNYVPGQS